MIDEENFDYYVLIELDMIKKILINPRQKSGNRTENTKPIRGEV